MSAFTGPLTITQLSGKPGAWRLWQLAEPLIYDVGVGGRTIDIPKGFITDGPSIPQVLWAVLPVWGSWGRAGVLHDYLCCLISNGTPHTEAPTRDDADRLFYASMRVLGVGRTTRAILYLGVRIGTWFGVRPKMIDCNDKLKDCIATALAVAEIDRALWGAPKH